MTTPTPYPTTEVPPLTGPTLLVGARSGQAAHATPIRISKIWGPISCSHWLPAADGRRPCGHNWALELGLAAPELDRVGMVWDYGELSPVKRLLDERIDHRHLDDVLGGMPATCEETGQRVAGFVHEQLVASALPFVPLVCDISVEDMCPGYLPRAWRAIAQPLGFHATHWLEGLPEGHKCGRKHGHRYDVGWEVDLAEGGSSGDRLRPAAAFVRRRLDRHVLNEVLDGLNPTAEHLALWLAMQFTGELQIPGILRVLVAETPTTLAEWQSPARRASASNALVRRR